MEQVTEITRLSRANRRLKFIVWILVLVSIVLLALVCFFLSTYFQSRIHIADESSDYQEPPIEKLIDDASVIVICTHKIVGDRLTCTITEILKQASDAYFPFKVGDEYKKAGQQIEQGLSYGDGVVIFFTGPNTSERYSFAYSDGRMHAYDGMTLNMLRDKVEKKIR